MLWYRSQVLLDVAAGSTAGWVGWRFSSCSGRRFLLLVLLLSLLGGQSLVFPKTPDAVVGPAELSLILGCCWCFSS